MKQRLVVALLAAALAVENTLLLKQLYRRRLNNHDRLLADRATSVLRRRLVLPEASVCCLDRAHGDLLLLLEVAVCRELLRACAQLGRLRLALQVSI